MRMSSPNSGSVTPQIGIFSYGTKKGPQQNAQWDWDVTQFRDPKGQKQFANSKGNDPEVVTWVQQDKRVPAILDLCSLLAEDLITPHVIGGKTETISTYVSFAFHDPHGTMIAPAVAELVATRLDHLGYRVLVGHLALPNGGKV